MTQPNPGDPKREITYNVGWKRGKIRQRGGGQADVWFECMWKPLPVWPSFLGKTLLLLFPVLSFAAVVWLVYMLAHSGL